ILVLEKGEEVGHHSLSGAVMDPRGITALLPDFRATGFPVEAEVVRDEMRVFTAGGSIPIREWMLPRDLRNSGNLIVTLHRVVRWMKEQAEAVGVDVYAGFGGAEILYDEKGGVAGARMRDGGIDRKGAKKSSWQPGMDVRAKVTVFAEGTRGSLAK